MKDVSDEPLPRLSRRRDDAHKGDFGLALIVGGSRGMTGAVALAGMAALRGGAGLVRLAVPDVCLDVVAGAEPSYMTVPLPSDDAGRIAAAARDIILERAETATVVGLGPGLGQSAELNELVGRLYVELPNPMVVDADALNALATEPEILSQHAGERVLTPHPGEFARLVGQKLDGDARVDAAGELAKQSNVVIVLKGHRTCTTDGQQSAINETGNPGMATGGSGDVLTGLIVAFLCQGFSPFDAARLGVYLHGLSGDIAAAEVGEVSLIASDLVQFLPDAFEEFALGD